MPDKFQNRHRISSARLSNWDYSSNAAYFITVYTASRQHYLGVIINSEMKLSKIGEYATECCDVFSCDLTVERFRVCAIYTRDKACLVSTTSCTLPKVGSGIFEFRISLFSFSLVRPLASA